MYNVPSVAGTSAAAAPEAVACAPAISARIADRLPGATIVACAPDRVSLVRGEQRIEIELAGGDVAATAETLTLPEIPAAVMRAFAVAYPKTITAGAIRRSRRGADPVYELAFPPGAAHRIATLRADGSIVDVR